VTAQGYGPSIVVAFSLLVTIYFVSWIATRVLFAPLAALYFWRHQHRHSVRSRALLDRLASPPLVSIVVPAYNEELTVVESVRSLLALDYAAREIVVVNDGSLDGTLEALRVAFELVPAPVSYFERLKTAPIRGLYRSIVAPELLVVDKTNAGCKSDASNAGINAASGELVLITDADTVFEPDAVTRGALQFLDNPDVVAVGGNIGIANGCRIESGVITDVRLPRSWLARFQIIEYMRSFLLFRLACASCNAVVLISGAFGMFRRDALIAVGGFDPEAVAEDMDITIRLQNYSRRHGKAMQIAFDPNPLGWTQVPEDFASLRSQRYRWRRGLLQVLWRHRRMIGNPRYGLVGLGVMSYIAFFEGLGAPLEIAGYMVTTCAWLLGILAPKYWLVMIAVAFVSGLASTLLAVLLNDLGRRWYTRPGELFGLLGAVAFEGFGYAQLNSVLSCIGTVKALTGKAGWGPMRRRPFGVR
jgi:cellulose synthase/poly-beta-1,6-N-acetylglucosamine synthase-like glycosyltransferase